MSFGRDIKKLVELCALLCQCQGKSDDMIVEATLAASCIILAFVYGITGRKNGQAEQIITKRKKKAFPPGPCGYPFIGVQFSINSDKIHLQFHDWKHEYGDIFMTKMMGKNIVVINSPELLRKAFVSKEFAPILSDRPLNFIGDVVLYGYKDILLRRYDDEFKKMKTLLKNCMNKHGFLSPQFRSLAEKEFISVVAQFRATEGKAFDPMDILMPSFCMLIGMFFFGKQVTPKDNLVQCITCIDKDGDVMIRPNVHCIYKMFPWIRKLPCFYGKLFQNVMRERNSLFQMIENDKCVCRKNESHGLVHSLLLAKDEYDWLTDEHVNGILMDLINTATLTTKSMISGFILLWLHYPEVQQKIRDEINKVIGRDGEPSIQDIESMPYTHACMYETLRYQSHLPMTAAHANLSQEVEFENMTIPKESVIFGNLYTIHHDESLWEDPWEFRPERYLTEQGTMVTSDHDVMRNNMAFGIGERRCVGKDMAINRMFLYTTHLLRSFKFLPIEGAELPSPDPRKLLLESPVLISENYKCRVIPC